MSIKEKHISKLFSNITNNNEPKVHNKYHKAAPADAVYIGRGSPWGNPYVIGTHGTREEVIELFRINILPNLDITPIRGKHLVCFCKPKPCHGDLLLRKANENIR